MQVGTTKDQGLYNKPSAVVHPGALAAGTLPQYNTIQYNTSHPKFIERMRRELLSRLYLNQLQKEIKTGFESIRSKSE